MWAAASRQFDRRSGGCARYNNGALDEGEVLPFSDCLSDGSKGVREESNLARAPETGYYFEPLTERLALVVEGAPFPSDDHWAWLGDPIEMTQEEARMHCGFRWPGVDPDSLEVEFDLDFEKATQEAEQQRLEAISGMQRLPREFDLDVDSLLQQADLLREAARQVSFTETTPEALEKAAEAEAMIRDLAQGLSQPAMAGQVIDPHPPEPVEAGPRKAPKAAAGPEPEGSA